MHRVAVASIRRSRIEFSGAVTVAYRRSRMKAMALIVMATVLIAAGPVIGVADDLGTFERVKTKTFDKEKFVFPDDVRGTKLNILFLSMGRDRESGEAQQLELLDWHDALAERGVFSEAVMPYHFPVLAGVPFFVKGMVTGGIRDHYEGRVPPDGAGLLFIKDLDKFAASAGLTADGEPTIVIASADGVPLQFFEGAVSEQGVDEIAAAIEALKD